MDSHISQKKIKNKPKPLVYISWMWNFFAKSSEKLQIWGTRFIEHMNIKKTTKTDIIQQILQLGRPIME